MRRLIDTLGQIGSLLAPVLIILAILATADEHDQQVARQAIATACFDGDIQC